MTFLKWNRTTKNLAASLAGTSASILGVLVFLGFFSIADAQTTEEPTQGGSSSKPEVQVFKDWRLRCANLSTDEKRCILLQVLVDQESNRPLMELAVGFWGPEKRRGLIITLPLGVTLPPGIELQIDDQPIGRAQYYQCAENGCHSQIPLEDDLLAKMRAGQDGVVTFRDFQGRKVGLGFSLRGFTAGFAAVQ